MRLGTADVLVRAQGTDKFEGDIRRLEGVAEKSFSKMALGVAAVGTAVGVAFGKMIQVGAEFELTMKTVGAVMRLDTATAEGRKNFELLEEAAKRTGATTEKTANESAEALKYLAMAGFDAQAAVKALPEVVNLSTAGQLSLAEASDIVTDSMTALGLKTSDLGKFNDILIGTITRSNTDIKMMGESLKYVAPIASNFGLKVEETAALIGTLANAGIKASDSGTDLRQALMRNQQAIDALSKSSINYTAIAKKLGIQEHDFISVIRAAKDAQWDANKVKEEFGMIASKSVLVLMDNIDSYQKLRDELGNVKGESAKLAAEIRDTTTVAFQVLGSVVESYGIDMFAAMGTSVKDNTLAMAGFLSDLKPAVIGTFKEIQSIAGNFSEIFDFTFPEASLSDFFLGLADSVKKGFGQISEFTGDEAFQKVSISILSNFGMIGDEVSEAFSELFSGLDMGELDFGDAIISGMEGFRDILVSVQPDIKEFISFVQDSFSDVGEIVTDSLSDVFDWLDDNKDTFTEFFDSMREGVLIVLGALPEITDVLKETFSDAREIITDSLSDVFDWLDDNKDTFTEFFDSIGILVSEAFGSFSEISDPLDEVGNSIEDFGGMVADIFEGTVIPAIRDFSEWVSDNRGQISDFFDVVADNAGVAFDALYKFGETALILAGVVKAVSLFSGVMATAKAAAALFSGGLASVGAVGGVLAAAVVGWQIGDWLYDNFEMARLAGLAMVDGLMKGWINVSTGAEVAFVAVQQGFLSMAEFVVGGLQSIVSGASIVWAGVAGGLGDMLKWASRQVADFIRNVAGSMADVPGMEDFAASVNLQAGKLLAFSNSIDGYSASVSKAEQAANAGAAAVRTRIEAMKAEVGTVDQAIANRDRELSQHSAYIESIRQEHSELGKKAAAHKEAASVAMVAAKDTGTAANETVVQQEQILAAVENMTDGWMNSHKEIPKTVADANSKIGESDKEVTKNLGKELNKRSSGHKKSASDVSNIQKKAADEAKKLQEKAQREYEAAVKDKERLEKQLYDNLPKHSKAYYDYQLEQLAKEKAESVATFEKVADAKGVSAEQMQLVSESLAEKETELQETVAKALSDQNKDRLSEYDSMISGIDAFDQQHYNDSLTRLMRMEEETFASFREILGADTLTADQRAMIQEDFNKRRGDLEKQFSDYSQEQAENRLKLEEKLYSDLGLSSDKYYEMELDKIEEQVEAYRQAGLDDADIAEWRNDQIRELDEKRVEALADVNKEATASFEDLAKGNVDAWMGMADIMSEKWNWLMGDMTGSQKQAFASMGSNLSGLMSGIQGLASGSAGAVQDVTGSLSSMFGKEGIGQLGEVFSGEGILGSIGGAVKGVFSGEGMLGGIGDFLGGGGIGEFFSGGLGGGIVSGIGSLLTGGFDMENIVSTGVSVAASVLLPGVGSIVGPIVGNIIGGFFGEGEKREGIFEQEVGWGADLSKLQTEGINEGGSDEFSKQFIASMEAGQGAVLQTMDAFLGVLPEQYSESLKKNLESTVVTISEEAENRAWKIRGEHVENDVKDVALSMSKAMYDASIGSVQGMAEDMLSDFDAEILAGGQLGELAERLRSGPEMGQMATSWLDTEGMEAEIAAYETYLNDIARFNEMAAEIGTITTYLSDISGVDLTGEAENISVYKQAFDSLNEEYDAGIDRLTELGVTQERLAEIEASRGEAEKKLEQEFAEQRNNLLNQVREQAGLTQKGIGKGGTEYENKQEVFEESMKEIQDTLESLGSSAEENAEFLTLWEEASVNLEESFQTRRETILAEAEKLAGDLGVGIGETDIEKQLSDTNQKFSDLSEAMFQAGGTAEEVAGVETLLAAAREEVTESYRLAKESAIRDASELAGVAMGGGMTALSGEMEATEDKIKAFAETVYQSGGSAEEVSGVLALLPDALDQVSEKYREQREDLLAQAEGMAGKGIRSDLFDEIADSVNAKFDEMRISLVDLGGTVEDVSRLESNRAAAIAQQQQQAVFGDVGTTGQISGLINDAVSQMTAAAAKRKEIETQIAVTEQNLLNVRSDSHKEALQKELDGLYVAIDEIDNTDFADVGRAANEKLQASMETAIQNFAIDRISQQIQDTLLAGPMEALTEAMMTGDMASVKAAYEEISKVDISGAVEGVSMLMTSLQTGAEVNWDDLSLNMSAGAEAVSESVMQGFVTGTDIAPEIADVMASGVADIFTSASDAVFAESGITSEDMLSSLSDMFMQASETIFSEAGMTSDEAYAAMTDLFSGMSDTIFSEGGFTSEEAGTVLNTLFARMGESLMVGGGLTQEAAQGQMLSVFSEMMQAAGEGGSEAGMVAGGAVSDLMIQLEDMMSDAFSAIEPGESEGIAKASEAVRGLAESSRETERAARTAAREAEKAARKQEAVARAAAREAEAAAREQAAAVEKAAREQTASVEKVARESELSSSRQIESVGMVSRARGQASVVEQETVRQVADTRTSSFQNEQDSARKAAEETARLAEERAQEAAQAAATREAIGRQIADALGETTELERQIRGIGDTWSENIEKLKTSNASQQELDRAQMAWDKAVKQATYDQTAKIEAERIAQLQAEQDSARRAAEESANLSEQRRQEAAQAAATREAIGRQIADALGETSELDRKLRDIGDTWSANIDQLRDANASKEQIDRAQMAWDKAVGQAEAEQAAAIADQEAAARAEQVRMAEEAASSAEQARKASEELAKAREDELKAARETILGIKDAIAQTLGGQNEYQQKVSEINKKWDDYGDQYAEAQKTVMGDFLSGMTFEDLIGKKAELMARADEMEAELGGIASGQLDKIHETIEKYNDAIASHNEASALQSDIEKARAKELAEIAEAEQARLAELKAQKDEIFRQANELAGLSEVMTPLQSAIAETENQFAGLEKELAGLEGVSAADIEAVGSLKDSAIENTIRAFSDDIWQSVSDSFGISMTDAGPVMQAEVSEFDQQVSDVHQAFDEWVGSVGELVDTEFLEKARSMALKEIKKAAVSDIFAEMEGIGEQYQTEKPEMSKFQADTDAAKQQFDELAERLKEVGAGTGKLTKLETEKQSVIEAIDSARRGEIAALLEDADAVISGFQMVEPVSEYASKVAEIEETFAGIIESVQSVGVSENELAEIRKKQNAAILAMSAQVLSEIDSEVSEYKLSFNTEELSEYQQSVSDVNAQFSGWSESMREAGADISKLEALESDKAGILQGIRDDAVGSVFADIAEIMTSEFESIDEINAAFADQAGILMDIGEAESELNKIEGQRLELIESFRSAQISDKMAELEEFVSGFAPPDTRSDFQKQYDEASDTFDRFKSELESIGNATNELSDLERNRTEVLNSLVQAEYASVQAEMEQFTAGFGTDTRTDYQKQRDEITETFTDFFDQIGDVSGIALNSASDALAFFANEANQGLISMLSPVNEGVAQLEMTASEFVAVMEAVNRDAVKEITDSASEIMADFEPEATWGDKVADQYQQTESVFDGFVAAMLEIDGITRESSEVTQILADKEKALNSVRTEAFETGLANMRKISEAYVPDADLSEAEKFRSDIAAYETAWTETVNALVGTGLGTEEINAVYDAEYEAMMTDMLSGRRDQLMTEATGMVEQVADLTSFEQFAADFVKTQMQFETGLNEMVDLFGENSEEVMAYSNVMSDSLDRMKSARKTELFTDAEALAEGLLPTPELSGFEKFRSEYETAASQFDEYQNELSEIFGKGSETVSEMATLAGDTLGAMAENYRSEMTEASAIMLQGFLPEENTFETQIADLNAGFDELSENLEKLGNSESEIIQVENDRRRAVEAMTASMQDQITGPLSDFGVSVDTWVAKNIGGLTDEDMANAMLGEMGQVEDMGLDGLNNFVAAQIDAYQNTFDRLSGTWEGWKGVESGAESVLSDFQTISNQTLGVMDSIPVLADESLEGVSEYTDGMKGWLDRARGVRNNFTSFADSVRASQDQIQKEISEGGLGVSGLLDLRSRQISEGIRELEELTPEDGIEKAGELQGLIMERYDLEKQQIGEVQASVESLAQASDNIKSKMQDLKYSSFNLLTQTERQENMTTDYASILAQAQSGDPEKINEYLGFIDTYLAQSQETYKSSEKYQEIWDQVNKDMSALGVTTEAAKSAEERHLGAIQVAADRTNAELSRLAEYADRQTATLDAEIANQTGKMEMLLGPSGAISSGLFDVGMAISGMQENLTLTLTETNMAVQTSILESSMLISESVGVAIGESAAAERLAMLESGSAGMPGESDPVSKFGSEPVYPVKVDKRMADNGKFADKDQVIAELQMQNKLLSALVAKDSRVQINLDSRPIGQAVIGQAQKRISKGEKLW